MAATTYTTTPEVRIESGFQYNADISDAAIDGKRLAAFSVINSKIGARYALPLTQNTGYATSPAKSLLSNIELLYASWLLLIQEYWNEAIWSDKDGYKKKTDADNMLNDILAGKLLLLDENGKEFLTNNELWEQGTQRLWISWFPKAWEYTRKFSVNQKF